MGEVLPATPLLRNRSKSAWIPGRKSRPTSTVMSLQSSVGRSGRECLSTVTCMTGWAQFTRFGLSWKLGPTAGNCEQPKTTRALPWRSIPLFRLAALRHQSQVPAQGSSGY